MIRTMLRILNNIQSPKNSGENRIISLYKVIFQCKKVAKKKDKIGHNSDIFESNIIYPGQNFIYNAPKSSK